MTEPSQYFKGRTVQEQMDEVIGYVDVRSAEVAVNAIASDVAQVHQDMLDADADASAAAASAAAAAGTLANAVKKTGEASQNIDGDIVVGGDLIGANMSAVGDLAVGGDVVVTGDISGGSVTVPAPVNSTNAANKKYVDDADALKLNITDVNSYAVGLTGNQNPVAGVKTYTSPLTRYDASGTAPSFGQMKMGNLDRTSVSSLRDLKILILTDMNDLEVFRLQLRKFNKTTTLYSVITDSTGTEHSTTLAAYTEP